MSMIETYEEDVSPSRISMPGVDGQNTGRKETSESACQRCADDVESETESQFGVAIEAGQVKRNSREYTSFSDTEDCR